MVNHLYTSNISNPLINGSSVEFSSVNLYRYGFNGYEKDDEIKGSGNSLDFGARIYDSRLGRFLSIDPAWKSFPEWSPYLFAANSPIKFIDVDGYGPKDGTIWKVVKPVEVVKDGDVQTIYLAKYYWDNLTPRQAERLAGKGSTNGWFVEAAGVGQSRERGDVDMTEQAVFGAWTPEKERSLGAGELMMTDLDVTEVPVFGPSESSGQIKVEAFDDRSLNIFAVDEDGVSRLLSSTTLKTGETNILDFDLNEGEKLYFGSAAGSVGAVELNYYKPAKEGSPRSDNPYDASDEPTEQDLQDLGY